MGPASNTKLVHAPPLFATSSLNDNGDLTLEVVGVLPAGTLRPRPAGPNCDLSEAADGGVIVLDPPRPDPGVGA